MYLIWQNNKIKIATVFLKIKNNTKHLSSDQNVNKHLAEIWVDSKEGSDSDLIIIIIFIIIFFICIFTVQFVSFVLKTLTLCLPCLYRNSISSVTKLLWSISTLRNFHLTHPPPPPVNHPDHHHHHGHRQWAGRRRGYRGRRRSPLLTEGEEEQYNFALKHEHRLLSRCCCCCYCCCCFFPVLLYPESETKRTKTVRQESVLQKGGGAQRSTTFQVNTDGSVMSRRSSVRFRFWNCVDVFFNIFFK